MKYLIPISFLISILAVGTVAYPQTSSNFKVRAYYEEAKKEFIQNEYEDALGYLDKAEKERGSTNGPILSLRIKCLYYSGRFIEAEKAMALFLSDYQDSVSENLAEETLSYFVRIEESAQAQKTKKVADAKALKKKNAQYSRALDKFELRTCSNCKGRGTVWKKNKTPCDNCNSIGSLWNSSRRVWVTCKDCKGKQYRLSGRYRARCSECSGRKNVLVYTGSEMSKEEASKFSANNRSNIISRIEANKRAAEKRRLKKQADAAIAAEEIRLENEALLARANLTAERRRLKEEADAEIRKLEWAKKSEREKKEALAPREEIRRKNEDTYATYTVESLGLKMVWIEAGSFTMGSPTSEDGRDNDEVEHRVTLSSGFWLGMYEVTLDEQVKMKNGGSGLSHAADQPSGARTWDDAMEFCSKLNDIEERAGRLPKGYRYSLPTESQWEYACRAGTNTSIPGGSLDSIAWHPGNSSSKRHPGGMGSSKRSPVGMKRPNAWGLCDMIGNSWEWCLDWYGPYPKEDVTDPMGPESGNRRVLRGGCSSQEGNFFRSASRASYPPESSASLSIGFRLALVPQP
jgi:formylglycine-generating enzyme required for sulfatase activity